MRPKKDPGIRQEAFIRAATELFMERGFEAVSIRDVLDAVSDKTASPSVFYYYFPSKDALYRACVDALAQDYLTSVRAGFVMEGKTLKEWMVSLVTCMEEYLLNERSLLETGSSTPNRLFILDMREQVTREMVDLWETGMKDLFAVPAEEAELLAEFLCGGISEMMFTFMLTKRPDRQSVQMLTEAVVRFCMNAMGLPEDQKDLLQNTLEELHRES